MQFTYLGIFDMQISFEYMHTCQLGSKFATKKQFTCLFHSLMNAKKKSQKSVFTNSEARCVCGVFTTCVVAHLSFAFCYWVCIELFAKDKRAT